MIMPQPYSHIVLSSAVVFGVLVVVATAATVTYDLVALRHAWPTVSRQVSDLSQTYPAWGMATACTISFAVGLLLGHLFLGNR